MNVRRPGSPLDCLLHHGCTGVVAADDARMDVLTGTRQVEATVPGAGSVILNSSPLPGELVETCRAPDQAVTAEAAESDPSPAPAAPEDPA